MVYHGQPKINRGWTEVPFHKPMVDHGWSMVIVKLTMANRDSTKVWQWLTMANLVLLEGPWERVEPIHGPSPMAMAMANHATMVDILPDFSVIGFKALMVQNIISIEMWHERDRVQDVEAQMGC